MSCISHCYRFTVMDTSFHASENDCICEDCGKCLKSEEFLNILEIVCGWDGRLVV